MNLLSLFSFFPKQHDFYRDFQHIGENIVSGADLLRRMVADPSVRSDLQLQLEECEHIGDRYTKEVIETLHKTFLTPIDREDIHTLITQLDDVLDHMNSVGCRLTLYQIQEAPQELTHIAGVIHLSAQEIVKALENLRGLKRPQVVLTSCIEVGRLENEADEAMNRALVAIFKSGWETTYLIRVKEVLEGLERTTDRCKDVSEVLQEIVLKHS